MTRGLDQGGRTRRERRRGGTRWMVVKRQAFERDYSLGYSTGPMAYEADHYVTVSDHPELEYDLANIRASHQCCNRRRHDKAGINLLGERSRDWRRALRG